MHRCFPGLVMATVMRQRIMQGAGAENDLGLLCRTGYERLERVFMSRRTHLIYTCPPSRVLGASQFKGGFLYPEWNLGYGRGMEDCAILGGVALSMLIDWHEVTGDMSLVGRAHELYLGLRNLILAHGVPGFVARGLCAEDGHSICVLSSRDQVTHFVHGLWRYYRSPLSSVAERKEIGELLTSVSERMLANCTAKNGYDFLRADGSRDSRGICVMWGAQVLPHEAARLPMVYLATWSVTGDGRWKKLYEGLIDEALARSRALCDSSTWEAWRDKMPDYSIFQMQTSLEVLLGIERDESRRKVILEVMKGPAGMAVPRAIALNGGDSRYLCGAGETLLTQLLDPSFAFSETMVSLLRRSLAARPLVREGAMRIVHLCGAYWRYRVRQLGGKRVREGE